MNDPAWKPDPQLLSAYFDGELEGRDQMADVRARIEAWLEDNPQAAQEWVDHLLLKNLWLDTTPPEPKDAAWERTLDAIAARRRQPVSKPARRPWLTVGVVAASIALFVGFSFGALRLFTPTDQDTDQVVIATKDGPKTQPDDGEELVIATADEVTILRIEDVDARAVVVGTFPVSGVLDLADSGDVCISCRCPKVIVRQGPSYRPMVYARVSAD
jgi:hypothetical protein